MQRQRTPNEMPAPLRPLAVICLADDRLRGICSLLFRRAGYRVMETANVEEARSAVESKQVAMLVAGLIADPDDRLAPVATDRGVEYVRLGPSVQIEELLRVFKRLDL